MVKIKYKDNHLSIAIQKNYLAGLKPKEISALFNISKQRVNYWIHTQIIKKEKEEQVN